jgi:hypothetical protein
MAVNAVLPVLHAEGRTAGDQLLSDRALQTYRGAPKLQENELTWEASRLFLTTDQRPLVDGARRQQGLIHLYRVFTSSGQSPCQCD